METQPLTQPLTQFLDTQPLPGDDYGPQTEGPHDEREAANPKCAEVDESRQRTFAPVYESLPRQEVPLVGWRSMHDTRSIGRARVKALIDRKSKRSRPSSKQKPSRPEPDLFEFS